MSQKYESNFHKNYVGGEGEVVEKSPSMTPIEVIGHTYEEILTFYRKYVGDAEAELPQVVLNELRIQGKIPS